MLLTQVLAKNIKQQNETDQSHCKHIKVRLEFLWVVWKCCSVSTLTWANKNTSKHFCPMFMTTEPTYCFGTIPGLCQPKESQKVTWEVAWEHTIEANFPMPGRLSSTTQTWIENPCFGSTTGELGISQHMIDTGQCQRKMKLKFQTLYIFMTSFWYHVFLVT